MPLSIRRADFPAIVFFQLQLQGDMLRDAQVQGSRIHQGLYFHFFQVRLCPVGKPQVRVGDAHRSAPKIDGDMLFQFPIKRARNRKNPN
jgi:hypothetical protein